MEENTTTGVPPCGQPAVLRPLLRLIGDMLADYGYPAMDAALIDLLSTDLVLLAVLQRIAFRLLAQGGNTCQQ